jgi:hypothetical protein
MNELHRKMSRHIPGICVLCGTGFCEKDFPVFLMGYLNQARVAPFPFELERSTRNKLLTHPVTKFNCEVQVKIIQTMLPGIIAKFQLKRMDMFKVRTQYLVEWEHIQQDLQRACHNNG